MNLKRQWVGLTDEHKQAAWDAMNSKSYRSQTQGEKRMVEMRWFVNSDFVKVLQYRYPIDKAQWGPVWSEWTDVPTVEEGK